jgi:hypothetical protein
MKRFDQSSFYPLIKHLEIDMSRQGSDPGLCCRRQLHYQREEPCTNVCQQPKETTREGRSLKQGKEATVKDTEISGLSSMSYIFCLCVQAMDLISL